VVNLPASYPPEEFNGIMVSGMDTPSGAQDFARPPLNLEALIGEKGPYIVETTFELLDRGDEGGWLDQMWRMTVARSELVLQLALSEEWSLFWAVFVFPDRLQHVLWKYVDPRHPRHDPSRKLWAEDVMLKFWIHVDRLLGELLAAFPDAHFLAVSDHGFGPYFKLLRVNRLLERLGYLRFDQAVRIDWAHTSAFAVGYHSAVYVNLKGREPQGIVEPQDYDGLCGRLISDLNSVCEDGKPVFEYVRHRSEVYSGPYLELAPDIVLAGHDFAVQVSDGFAHESTARAEVFDELIIIDSGHHPDGILMARGPKISSGSQGLASIVDIMPTAMYLLGVPVPIGVDGKVVAEAVEKSLLAAQPPSMASYALEAVSEGEDYSEEQMQQVLKRLRDLGYIE
jgi:predicted AlkP superfamily phosphohydrolase/phosphomutase